MSIKQNWTELCQYMYLKGGAGNGTPLKALHDFYPLALICINSETPVCKVPYNC